MATTTNYGWDTPDDTDLVKDGASAIRTLGSSIDTTLKNLNPQTTTGAIAYRSSTANVNTSLTLGTVGQVLTVNSGATAPEWATPTSGGMTLISTTTLDGTPTTVLSSIPQTYIDLKIIIRLPIPANDTADLSLRINNDSTASRYLTYGSNTAPSATTFPNDMIFVSRENDNATSQGLVTILIPDYTNTVTWKQAFITNSTNDATTTTSSQNMIRLGVYNQTSAVSSLGILFDSGNATSGTILLYGVK